MKLHLKKDGMLSDIQKEFSDCFPYLRIDFFRFPHTDKKLSPKNEKINKYTPVNQFVSWKDDVVFEIDGNMTIGKFESMMGEVGLFVQVLRNSGRVWVETSYTDDWTLERQNEEGKMLSSIHNVESEKQVDWDDWDELGKES